MSGVFGAYKSGGGLTDGAQFLIMPLKGAMKTMRRMLTLFLTFLKIGAFTFGGGYAMIALLENEFVEKKATYEQETVNCGSGIPVLIVTTNESNNTGYYNGDYYDPTAYWVKDGVFYTLRVFGDEVDQDEIRMVLDRILAEI